MLQYIGKSCKTFENPPLFTPYLIQMNILLDNLVLCLLIAILSLFKKASRCCYLHALTNVKVAAQKFNQVVCRIFCPILI